MIHISTFSGIGGFELAAQWMGWKNYASCEINPFGSKVLEYYWPEAYHHKDIKTLTYEILNNELIQRFGKGWRNEPVVLTGGFPCQDASIAKQYGERQQGLQGERTGLFYEFSRLISELRPSWIISENVSNLLKINGGGGILARCSPNYPQWGIMQNGEFVLRQKSVRHITERGCIWLLTPKASDYKRNKLSLGMWKKRHNRSSGSLTEHLYRLFGEVTGWVNPQLFAWLMGFPTNYLDIPIANGESRCTKHSETQ